MAHRSFLSKKSASFGLLALLVAALGEAAPDKRRGHPGDYDPGPTKGSAFSELYGQAPNYRAIGQYVLDGNSEKFRWVFGPMWYRGRLGENEVKAFVVGQEGAQDENVSNRAFTGSTGTKTQKFLNHLGLTDQYLIMNTFVYTINGQLDHEDRKFKWMEQGAERGQESPIVEYRHKLFDQMAKQNKNTLQLILGVGSGGKASVATWVNSHSRGVKCSPANDLAKCDTSDLKRKFGLKHDVLVIGVPHPGGASPNNGGANALKNIVRGFTNAAKRVATKVEQDEAYRGAWFDGISENQSTVLGRLKTEYRYGNAPIPFRDFAFGTNWRMGDQGTTSNRRGQDAIQVFSADGKYNNTGHTVRYKRERDNTDGLDREGRSFRIPGPTWLTAGGMLDFDLPYEMPRFDREAPDHVKLYDHGPCGGDVGRQPASSCALSKALQSWPDFWKLSVKPTSHESFGHGPIYRGRFQRARLLVLADQHSQDDFFSTRALTGKAGQRLQQWLQVVGVGSRYAILRTLPVDTEGLDTDEILGLALEESVVKARNAIVAEIKKVAERNLVVVTLGEVAKEVAKSIPGIEVVAHLESPDGNHASGWDAAAKAAARAAGTDKEGTYDGRTLLAIARVDLPAHTRWWMGSTGTRAAKGQGNDDVVGNYYQVHAPKWVASLRPRELTREEKALIDERMAAANLQGRGETDAAEGEYLHPAYSADDLNAGFKRIPRDEEDLDFIADEEISKKLQTTGITVDDVEALELKGRSDDGATFIELDPATGLPRAGEVEVVEGE